MKDKVVRITLEIEFTITGKEYATIKRENNGEVPWFAIEPLAEEYVNNNAVGLDVFEFKGMMIQDDK